MNINLKKVIIFSLTILLNLSFFPVASINATLKEDNLSSAREFQKRAALNNDGQIGQEVDLSNKKLGALKIKKLETKSEQLNLEKELQSNSVQTKSNYVFGEILVKYRSNKINLQTISGRDAASSFISSRFLEKKEDLRKSNISVLRIKEAKTVEQKIAELKNDPNIEYAEPNYKRYPASINTNDTSRGLLWGLDNTGQPVNGISGTNDADIDAPEAWAISEATTSAPVIVAIIDSGVAYNHPDLAANMWDGTSCKNDYGVVIPGGCNHGYDYEDGDNTPLPTTSSHGTHIAGIIAAIKNNGKGIIGVAPQAKIMAIKYGYNIASEVKAIDFAIQNGAKIINASFTGTNFSSSELDAINRFKNAGGIFVAAAGNDSTNNDGSIHFYPSDYNLSNIISVAATDQNDALASFSNYGVTSVDVGAPGGEHPNSNDGVIYSAVVDTNFLNEDFEGVVPPSIGNKFTQDLDSTWGTIKSGDITFIASDYANWGSYQNDIYSRLYSPTINLNGKSNSYLNFVIGCSTESGYDSLGLWFYNGLTWELIDVFSGEVMEVKNYNLSNYVNSNFRFRFTWLTDLSVNSTGCLLDDISVVYYSNGSDEKYGWKDGTSMAAPYVAGLAALIEGYNPSLTATKVKQIILDSGDLISGPMGLVGKTVTGKRINAQKALQAANPAKAITAFSFTNPVATSTINETAHTIAVTVPYGTNVTALVPTIATSTGASVSPASGVAQNFTNPVTYTVTAADSSTQTYIVTVTIAPAINHSISGTIKYYDGVKVIPNAAVILENSIGIQIASTTTDVNGAYQFAGVTSGGDYVVRVIKSDNALGLTSADQIKIGRHIVGLELFSTIYKTIAGDVNNSLGISSADQIKIGRFIVGLDSNLPSGAWKFYASNAVLTTANYLTVGLTRAFTNLIADMPSQDFVGIKMGDVNNSWVNN